MRNSLTHGVEDGGNAAIIIAVIDLRTRALPWMGSRKIAAFAYLAVPKATLFAIRLKPAIEQRSVYMPCMPTKNGKSRAGQGKCQKKNA